jgi:hypothetical protein
MLRAAREVVLMETAARAEAVAATARNLHRLGAAIRRYLADLEAVSLASDTGEDHTRSARKAAPLRAVQGLTLPISTSRSPRRCVRRGMLLWTGP